MKNHIIYIKIIFLLFFSCVFNVYSFDITEGHRGVITGFIHKGDRIITAAEDGYIAVWDLSKKTLTERFQLTTSGIQALASHPALDEICVIESAGIDNFKISVWNYVKKQKIFSVHSDQPVTGINYSGNGSFIIASGFDGLQAVFLDSKTGVIMPSPVFPHGTVTFAATGRAERNILVYQNETEDFFYESEIQDSEYGGQFFYLDLPNGSVMSNFRAPVFYNPVIFSSNRYLAGISSRGLLLADAATGDILDIIENIDRNALLCSSSNDIFLLGKTGGRTVLSRYSVDRNGRFLRQQETPLVFSAPGTQTRIEEIAVGEKNIAFLTEDNGFCIIPFDYNLLKNNTILGIEKKLGFSKITSISSEDEDRFILWQSENTRLTPQIVNSNYKVVEQNFNLLPGRFPIRSISRFNDRLLLLDSSGSLSIYNLANLSSRAEFTFTSSGANDASFITNDYIVISRSAVNNDSPFISVNSRTGETVPVSFNAQAGLLLYSGKSGNVYAEAAERDGNRFITTVLNLTSSSYPIRVYEYKGESTHLSIAESSGILAVSCGSDGAFLISGNKVFFERTNGLPVKLLAHNNFFISLDSEGNIAWHNNRNGRLLAVLCLYADRWVLKTNVEIQGKFSYTR